MAIRILCDPPEDGGRGMPLEQVQNMTMWQLAMFSMDKKHLKNSQTTVNSFAEARALLKARKEAKKRGNKAR